MSSPAEARVLTYGEAVFEATRSEMARDPKVFVMGQGVDDARGMFGTTLGLHKEFGAERNFDVPLAEDAMTGIGIGAALMGMRPIQVHQRMDFVLLCMNQIVNMAAKMSYMFSGAHKVPLVIRAIIGRSWGQGAQHSQAFHSYFMHIPGLRVVAPTTPHDAKGCLISAIRDNNPTIFVEHRLLYPTEAYTPNEAYTVPFGKARVVAKGDDVTMVGVSNMVIECLRAHELLAEAGISTEVIDPIWLAPLDIDTICESVERTGRLLVVDTAWTNCGAAAEIVARLHQEGLAPGIGEHRRGDLQRALAQRGGDDLPRLRRERGAAKEAGRARGIAVDRAVRRPEELVAVHRQAVERGAERPALARAMGAQRRRGGPVVLQPREHEGRAMGRYRDAPVPGEVGRGEQRQHALGRVGQRRELLGHDLGGGGVDRRDQPAGERLEGADRRDVPHRGDAEQVRLHPQQDRLHVETPVSREIEEAGEVRRSVGGRAGHGRSGTQD